MAKQKTIVIGHKNPDTDSICSAISYAYLKNQLNDGEVYEARRAGELNEETRFVLRYFKIDAPKLTTNVRTQVKDIDIRNTEGVHRDISLKKAWELMQNLKVFTLPVVGATTKKLEGIITVSDIANSYMNIYDSSELSKAVTMYANIIETLEGEMLVGEKKDYFYSGKVLVATANPDMMEDYIEKDDLVILGNRYESQLSAIEMEAACIIVCEGAKVSKIIKKLALERGTAIISTKYDSFTAARLINQSMPIKHFMKTHNLVSFEADDYLDEIKDVMASLRHRDFPILDKKGRYLGMISRRNLLGAKGKKLILVDHNERTQAVDGMEDANLLEVIDHHRLGTVETIGPVYFRAQPLGCTATIIYQIFQEKNIKIPEYIAGLLCSAIISDTLLFRSPTCTQIDKEIGLKLAEQAGIDIQEYAIRMFSAGSNLGKKTDDQIFRQDYKTFSFGKTLVGIGQISSINMDELQELEKRLLPYLREVHKKGEEDMIFFMLTNILEESTRILCIGSGADALIMTAFRLEQADFVEEQVALLRGVVSRKKQLVPALVMATSI